MIDKRIAKRIISLCAEDKFKNNPAFYLYDLVSVKKQLGYLEKFLPKNVSVYYAMKANPHKEVLRFLSEHKRCNGIEIASKGELDKALKYFNAENICFTGPGKTIYELKASLDSSIELINLESLTEARRINEIAESKCKVVDVLIRVNSNYCVHGATSTNMAGLSTKFGIEEDDLIGSIKIIQKEMPFIKIKGFHVFGASGIMDSDVLIDYTNSVLDLVSNVEKEVNIKAEIIDLGGGFGIDYTKKNQIFDLESYSSHLKESIDKLGYNDRKIILELGRYIVGECGYYCSEILDIKESKGKKYIIMSGGVNHLNRPNVTGENQPIEIIPRDEEQFPNIMNISGEIVDVCGPLCFAEDKLGKKIFIKSAKIGDILVVTKAGAYGCTGSPLDFLSHPHPEEYYETITEDE